MGRFFRRFFRYAFHLAAGFSTLAMAAVLFFWSWSYYRWDAFTYQSLARDDYSMFSSAGILRFSGGNRFFSAYGPGCHHTGGRIYRGPSDWSYTDFFNRVTRPGPGEFQRDCGGLGVRLDSYRAGATWHIGLDIPFSYGCILTALLPACWLRGFVRRRRRARLARPGFPVEPAAPAR